MTEQGQRSDAAGRYRGARYLNLNYRMLRLASHPNSGWNRLKTLLDIALRFNGENDGRFTHAAWGT